MTKRVTGFATRLKELRDEAGVSMAQLAKAVGVSDAAVCKWENGDAEPKASYIVRLAEYFDCSIEYLLGVEAYHKTGNVKPKVTVTDRNGKAIKAARDYATVTTDERIVVESYNKLTPDMKDLFKSTLAAWVANGETKKDNA